MSATNDSTPKLFQPATIGDITLAHRVVLAPVTRARASTASVPGDLMVEYYTQRASIPGTLLISEGTFIAPQSGGHELGPTIPGMWNDEQVAGWKKVVDAVHAKGSFIYLQMWTLGRGASAAELKAQGFDLVSSSDLPVKDTNDVPRPLTVAEIKEYVNWFAKAASDAVHHAGFDGVEVHCANGYLLDQFIQDVTNKRTDQYGGSIENRARFPLEVVDAVVKAVGAKKTGIRFSPWSKFLDMRMEDPVPTFSYLIKQLRELYPDFAYVHLVEPGILGGSDVGHHQAESNDFVRDLWHPRPLITAGGYTRESGVERAEKTGDILAFGRRFIANPDLPLRLRKDLPLTPYDRSTFYIPQEPHGYTDYPFAVEA
ncbi:FMN-linked oxidoreductase [Lenzites betulinus]|nr:FMN-linked oxidoreductase [Lenzites betulinus]